MQVAYGLICYTAFFDALDRRIPKALRAKIKSLEPAKAFLIDEARGKNNLSSEGVLTLVETNPIHHPLYRFHIPQKRWQSGCSAIMSFGSK